MTKAVVVLSSDRRTTRRYRRRGRGGGSSLSGTGDWNPKLHSRTSNQRHDEQGCVETLNP